MNLKRLALAVGLFFLLSIINTLSADQNKTSYLSATSESNLSQKQELYLLFVNTYIAGVECNVELENYFDTGVLPDQQVFTETCGVFGEMAVIAIEAYDAAPAAVRGDKDLVEEVVGLDRLRGIVAPKIRRFRNEVEPR
jgi:hypothetical protein